MTARSPRSLRWRVTMAATGLGLVLSLLFTAVTVFVAEEYEDTLVGELLEGQAQDYSLRLAVDPMTPLPQSHRLSGYLRRTDGSGTIPPELLGLAPGFYDDDPRLPPGIHAGVYDIDQGRLYFAIDLSDIEATERLLAMFVAAVFVIGTAFSAWLGWFLAGASLAPVRRLAGAVDALSVMPERTQLASAVGADELGRLASAIDDYQGRLVDADAHERRFFADASHELRTPIAVVRGVTEVILDDDAVSPGMRQRLGRLDRGIGELTMLLDVLLGLARRRERVIEAVPAQAVIEESLATLTALTGNADLQVQNNVSGTWQVPQREAVLVLQGVLRRLLVPEAAGRLQIDREGQALSLRFSPRQATTTAPPDAPARSDTGLGLTLVSRLAEALGWRIEEVVEVPGLRHVRILLPVAALDAAAS